MWNYLKSLINAIMDNLIKQWTIALMIWMRLMSDIECFEKVTRNLFCSHMEFNCLWAFYIWIELKN